MDNPTDFLIYGDKNEKAQASIKDIELLQQFIEVDKMNGEDKKTIKNLIDAFITNGKLKQLAF
jgi:hypothetical protein